MVIARGTDARSNILSSAELYNSELQAWVTLPTTNMSRKMCSGVFMEKKFYVIGGMARQGMICRSCILYAKDEARIDDEPMS